MKVKVTIEGVGVNQARVEVEENCEPGGLKRLLNEVESEFAKLASTPPSIAGTQRIGTPVTEDGFIPASEEAKKALWAAAMSNGTDPETVCREFGVDPNHISKHDCWLMTRKLNERSGYGNN